ncbi:Aromatic-L-amino-acid decarboxylase, partial [Leucoagaricus sp. SymC.cos]
LTLNRFRKAGYAAIDRICNYYASLSTLPVKPSVSPGYLSKHIPKTCPQTGEPFNEILDDYSKLILPGLTHWQHPSFFGFFPTGCTFEGMIADLLTSSACNPGFNWASSPACTELEVLMMDWAADLLGLHKDFFNSSGKGGGTIQTTASDSALTAAVAARSLYSRAHPDVPHESLVVYTTTQTHSLGLKAGKILGLNVRALEVEAADGYALRGSVLKAALGDDLKNGKHPFILIATIGTTSSGTYDNLQEIKEVAKEYPSLWIHVDAAWAGVALSCPEYREKLYHAEINEIATSFCTNFHKWGLVNFDCSTLWVRDRTLLTEALDITPPFLRSKESDSGLVIDYRNWHLALGRRFRSLKLWFVFRSYGAEGFRSYIKRCVDLNISFQSKLAESSLLELVTTPSLSLSVFRISPVALSSPASTTSFPTTSSPADSSPASSAISFPNSEPTLETLNTVTKTLFSRLSSRTDILLTQTILNGIFCIRFVVGSERTGLEDVYRAVDVLVEEAQDVVGEWKVMNEKMTLGVDGKVKVKS